MVASITSTSITIRSTIINRGFIRLFDLELPSNITQYTQELKDFFAAHHVTIEGEDNEIRFIGQENSLTSTSDEINNFVKQQKAREEHVRLVTLYKASLPSINNASLGLYKLGIPQEIRLLINSFTKPSPLKI